MKALNKFICSCILLTVIWTSCKVERVKLINEPVKDITGTWKIIKATRNGTDITIYNGTDFSRFSIVFKSGTYTLINRLPFIVDTSGTYKLNDPQYPGKITFNPVGSAVVNTTFLYPIATGARNIDLTFSIDQCATNVYVYTLQQVN